MNRTGSRVGMSLVLGLLAAAGQGDDGPTPTRRGAAGGVDGVKNGQFGFHTGRCRFRFPVCWSRFPLAILYGPVAMVQATARESEGRIPSEGELRFPADRLEAASEARLNQRRQIHTNQVKR